MTIGEKIKKIRKEKEIPRSKLADLAGMSQSHLYHIEKNENIPKTDLFINIVKALNISADYFVYDDYEERLDSTKIKDVTLLNQFQEIEKLDEENKNFVIKFIDMVIDRAKIKSLMND